MSDRPNVTPKSLADVVRLVDFVFKQCAPGDQQFEGAVALVRASEAEESAAGRLLAGLPPMENTKDDDTLTWALCVFLYRAARRAQFRDLNDLNALRIDMADKALMQAAAVCLFRAKYSAEGRVCHATVRAVVQDVELP